MIIPIDVGKYHVRALFDYVNDKSLFNKGKKYCLAEWNMEPSLILFSQKYIEQIVH
jgi:hypothetical protein